MRRALRRALAAARRERGALSVETVIIMPVLLWVLGAMYVFWDGYRAASVATKATYTVSDLLSRRTDPIDQVFVNGTRTLFASLASGGRPVPVPGDDTAIRVSVVTNKVVDVDGLLDDVLAAAGGIIDADAPSTELTLAWSTASGVLDPLVDVESVRAAIPDVSPGDQVIVVETEVAWEPLFAGVGLPGRRFRHVAVTRPRFVPRLCWLACD